MASNKEDFKKDSNWKLAFIANATTKVTYRKLAIQFGQCKSSRQKLEAKVVKTELNQSFW